MLGHLIKRLVEEILVAEALDRRYDREEVLYRIERLVEELDKITLPSWEGFRDALENDLPLPPPLIG